MGLIQSVFCSMIFCVERVLTWTCCAFVLMLMMFSIIILMIYGISVGYHYAQKELASFARWRNELKAYDVMLSGYLRPQQPQHHPGCCLNVSSRSTTEPSLAQRRSGSENVPIVRLVAVNRTEVEHAPQPILEVYQTKKPGEHLYLETSENPVVLLETERPPMQPEFSQQEKEVARRLISRYRRSRNSTQLPFYRPLNSTEPLLLKISA